MNKIANLMKRAAFVSGVTGALIIGATTIAPAHASTAHTPTSHASKLAGPPAPPSYGDCTYNLEYVFAYEVTNTRRSLCLAASASYPSAATRVSICTAGMQMTGVDAFAAFTSCLSATA